MGSWVRAPAGSRALANRELANAFFLCILSSAILSSAIQQLPTITQNEILFSLMRESFVMGNEEACVVFAELWCLRDLLFLR